MSADRPSDEPLIDAALLELLLRTDEPITVESLALRRRLSRGRTLTELDRLRAAGCTFDAHPQHGLRLTAAGLGTWVDYLRHLGPADRVIEVYRQTASTQDLCRRIVEAHGTRSDGALALAHDQTAGRGRLGRRWHAPAGSAVTFSRVRLIKTPDAGSVVDRLTFASCVAVARAADRLLGGRAAVTLKWPNDVYVDGRKLAGILVETFRAAAGVHAAIIGVGFNVALRPEQLPADDPALRSRITSLAMQGVHIDRLRVLGELVPALDEALDRTPLSDLLEEWRRRSAMLHQHVRMRSAGGLVEGQVIDLDPHEGLIVRTTAGQIVHLPAAVTTGE